MNIPDHISAERIIDVDIFTLPEPGNEFHSFLKRLHNENIPRLFWTPQNGGHWVATRSELIERIFEDSETFSSQIITVPKQLSPTPPVAPLQVDPPESQKFRALLAEVMSARMAKRVSEDARKLASDLIDGLIDKGRCEFVSEFARHIPASVFLNMCGLPMEDRDELVDIIDFQMHSDPSNKMKGLQQMFAYLSRHVHSRRETPKDDFISRLTQAKIDGELLSDYQLFGLLNVLFMGGQDSVASTLAICVRFLADNREHRQQLINQPKLIPRAVEELLRRFAFFTSARLVVKDVEIDSMLLKTGDMIAIPTALFGLDEQRYTDPLKVDFKRSGKSHCTFGRGAHHCPGAALARAELRVFIEVWLNRIPEFKVEDPSLIKLGQGQASTILRLPVSWPVSR